MTDVKCDNCNGTGDVSLSDYGTNCRHCKGTGIMPEVKPFDITKHEWSDREIELLPYSCSFNRARIAIGINGNEEGRLNKNDAIALAKHFKLTPEDLT